MTAVPYVNAHIADDGRLTPDRSLLDAAAKGDVAGVLHALHQGADPHFADAGGRTVVGCAIAGERWEEADATDASFLLERRLEILKALLRHAKISLAAMNAPLDAMRGVTPLGLAAWLNIPDIVRTLLNECPGLVSVNGMDASGATPLMYAARDGRVEVVHDLLINGARPDYRDVNQRSSVQYALRHPQVLWLCESALRRHRASDIVGASRSRSRVGSRSRERSGIESSAIVCHPRFALKPPKQDLQDMVDTLLSTVKAGDAQGLSSLVLPTGTASNATPPPFLVNYPDPQGWCAIHHCMIVDTPSVEIVDVLYRAGADLSLYTRSGHGTPLHCLARRSQTTTPPSITDFIRHLVLDLRAPLAAKDAEDETPLHIAAEHGHSLEILLALLECDTSGKIQEMRNARGLTPLEVAQPHLKVAFIISAESDRSASSASMRTIKPSAASVEAANTVLCADPLRLQISTPPPKQAGTRESISDLNMRIFPHSIIENLLSTSHELDSEPEKVTFAIVEDYLEQTTEMGEDVLVHMQSRLNHAMTELHGARQRLGIVEAVVGEVRHIAGVPRETPLVVSEYSWDVSDAQRRRTTDSDSSERTAVSSAAVSSANLLHVKEKNASDVYIPLSVHSPSIPRSQFTRTMDAVGPTSSSSSPFPSSLHDTTQLLRPTKSLVDLRQSSQGVEEKGFLKLPWVKDITRKRSKSDIQAHVDATERASFLWVTDTREPTASGVSRVKAWFRKKLMPDLPAPPAGERSTYVPVEEDVRGRPSAVSRLSTSSAIRPAVRLGSAATWRVLRAIDIDLLCIQEYLTLAERYANHSNRSIAQARRLLARSIERRKAQLIHAKNTCDAVHAILPPQRQSDSLVFLPVTIPTSPRDSQLVFPKPPSIISSSFSSASSITSEAAGEDEDLRALRRLLTRKIDSRIETANENLAKAMIRIQIVKDVVRTLRRSLS